MATLATAHFNVVNPPFKLFETRFKIILQWFKVFRASTERNQRRDRWEPISRNEAAHHHSDAQDSHPPARVQAGHRLLHAIKHPVTRAIEVLELVAVRPLTHAWADHPEFAIVMRGQLVGEARRSMQSTVRAERTPKTID